jgi:hypothetical protein
MRRNAAYLLAASAALLAAGQATAAIDDVRTGTEATTKLRGQLPVGPVVNGPPSLYLNDYKGQGTGYSAFTDTDSQFIYFESGSMTAGAGNASRSVTEVAIDLTADANSGQIDRLVSSVFGSSFGFYVAGFGAGEPVCAGITLPTCGVADSGAGFGELFNQMAVGASIATSRIAFDVLLDGAVVRSIAGSITMVASAGGQVTFVENFGSGADALGSVLSNFRFDGIDNYAYGYTWDDTAFTVLFPDALDIGESGTVTYRITTQTMSLADPRIVTDNAVIAYACFPDPVGRGGGNESSAPFRAMNFAGNESDDTCDDFSNPDTRKYALQLPTLKDGAVVFGPGDAPGVPEPASWAMLIAGFGLVGAGLRRRRAAFA